MSATTPAFPAQPTGVTATATAEGTISLAWADSADEDGYRIERSVNGSTGWTQVGTAVANSTSYSDTGLPENTRYYYRVIATNAVGDSAPSATISAVVSLATPNNVAATFMSGGRIDLSWTDRSSAETGYSIEQSADGVSGWSQVGTAAANATSFSASGPFNGSSAYYFRVRATNALGNSAYSATVSATTPAVPARPSSLTATATADGTITLAWANTFGEDGYRIERSTDGSTGWTPVGTAAADATSYSDTGLAEATRYYYRVVATAAAGDSAPSVSANVFTRPNTPDGVAATAVSNSRIDLSWTDRSSSESGYVIEQSADGVGGWSQVGTTAANATSFSALWAVQRVEHVLLPGPGFELLGWQLGVLGASVDDHAVVPQRADGADGDGDVRGDDHAGLGGHGG